MGCCHVLFLNLNWYTWFTLLEIPQRVHLGYIHFSVCILYFTTLKSFGNTLAELKSRLREKGGLIKEKMRINL